MLFLLLPFIFNPFSFIVRWLPALYLAAWPIIIQTLGQEALLLHAIILIMFILTCDITRELMLKIIGFDLVSLPAGVALLAMLLTDKGSSFLSLVIPICSTLLVVVEPLSLLLEIFIVMEMLKAFNRWISRMSNIRDEDSNDLSTWDPPLTRGSLFMRFVVILITSASYLGAYMIIQESKTLLGAEDKIYPIQFKHAIALLVTLQLIALTSTIYKDEGILSESAMVALTASVPIFIASWSYYHLKTTAADSSSSWASYFPFSIFASGMKSSSAFSSGAGLGSLAQAGEPSHLPSSQRIVFSSSDHSDAYQSNGAFGFGGGAGNDHNQLDYGALEQSIQLIAPADSVLKQVLLAFSRQLIMLINSILGLSWDKLAKYYFGPDFWYILSGRLVCLICLVLFGSSSASSPADGAQQTSDAEDGPPAWGAIRNRLARFKSRLPINRRTLIKCLIVLAYAQMLIQQMENRHNLVEQTNLLLATHEHDANQQLQSSTNLGCCGKSSPGGQGADKEAATNLLEGASSWLSCIWSSAHTCSQSPERGLSSAHTGSSRASRLLEALTGFLGQVLAAMVGAFAYAYNRLANAPTTFHYVYTLWLARWRSPIIQRLMQSLLIQIYYIVSLVVSGDSQERSADGHFL